MFQNEPNETEKSHRNDEEQHKSQFEKLRHGMFGEQNDLKRDLIESGKNLKQKIKIFQK